MPATSDPRPRPRAARIFAGLLIIVAVGLAYANSFPGSFFFDDDAALLRNDSIRHLTDLRRVFWPPVEAGIGGRPFANLTFALNYAFGGYRPAGYHAVNLAIHLGATLLLFALTRRTLLLPIMRPRFAPVANLAALAVALLWGLHPLQTAIVDYVSQRTEGLMALLYLLTLYAYLRATESTATLVPSPVPVGPEPAPAAGVSVGWTSLAVASCALGMATKEDMVTAPVMVLLYDRTFVTGGFGPALRRHWRPLLGLAATWVLLAGLMCFSKLEARGVGFGFDHGMAEYARTECRAVVDYLRLSLWPDPLVFDYGTNYYVKTVQAALPSAALLAALLAATVWALWRAPRMGFAAAWFFVLLAPSSSIIPVAQQPCAENRAYLPLAGVVMLMGVGGFRVARRAAPIAFAAVALILGIATFQRNVDFASELAVWRDAAAKNPGNARAQNNLGNALLKLGRGDDAAPHFRDALRISPNYADARNNLGVTFLRAGQPAEALAEFKQAAEFKADYVDAYYNQGEAYLQLHREAEAVAPLQQAIALDPANAKAHNNLGIALLDLGRVGESIHEERIAIALNDRMPEAHYNLANSLSRAGKIDAALEEYDATLEIDPRFAKAHNNAGVLLLDRGRLADARQRFEAALRIDPNYPEARKNLDLVQRRLTAPAAKPIQLGA